MNYGMMAVNKSSHTSDIKVGDWVEFDVPYVEGIGPAYTTRGRVASAEPGHMLVLRPCTDGEEHWRSRDEVRLIEEKYHG